MLPRMLRGAASSCSVTKLRPFGERKDGGARDAAAAFAALGRGSRPGEALPAGQPDPGLPGPKPGGLQEDSVRLEGGEGGEAPSHGV